MVSALDTYAVEWEFEDILDGTAKRVTAIFTDDSITGQSNGLPINILNGDNELSMVYHGECDPSTGVDFCSEVQEYDGNDWVTSGLLDCNAAGGGWDYWSGQPNAWIFTLGNYVGNHSVKYECSNGNEVYIKCQYEYECSNSSAVYDNIHDCLGYCGMVSVFNLKIQLMVVLMV